MIPPWYIPHMGLGAGAQQPNPLYGAPDDGRTPYTGTFQTGVDARSEAGNPNNVTPGQGPTVGPTGWFGGVHTGPIPLGGWSQLGGRANDTYSGYYPTTPPISFPGGEINGLPLSGPNGIAAHHAPEPVFPGSAPVAARHAPEPGRAPGTMWAGGFGLSDNSAWGNKGDAAQLSRSGVNGSLKDTTNQSTTMGARPNAMLPGAGSAFGLGVR